MDAGVVDQDVHRPDRGGETERPIRIVDVERDGADVAADTARLRLALVEVARPQEHPQAAPGELTADLEPDAAIGPRDQRDALYGCVRHRQRPFARSAAAATRPLSPTSRVRTNVISVTFQRPPSRSSVQR